jgi:hypothetical protein
VKFPGATRHRQSIHRDAPRGGAAKRYNISMSFKTLLLLVSRPESTRQSLPVSSPQFAKEAMGPRRGLLVPPLYVLAMAACLVGVLADVARAQQPSDTFGKWAATRVIRLRTVEADGDATDLVPLTASRII